MVRVALRYDTAGGNQSDAGMLHILDSRAGLNSVEGGHRILGYERLVVQLSDQHVNCTLSTDLLIEEVNTNAVGHIVLLRGNTNLLALCKLQSQRSHVAYCLSHTCSVVLGRNDVNLGLEHISTRVLLVHTGYYRKAKLFLNSVSYGTAGNAVTSCVECRSAYYEVSALRLDHIKDGLKSLLLVLVEIGVTADNGCNDLCLSLECCVHSSARAYNALAKLRLVISLLLAADSSEELVNIMYAL